MPRRKGHGIPPTKRVKHPDAITRSAPLKNKLYNGIPLVNLKEEPIQMTVNTVPIKSDPPSIISDALHSKYLHKKFKKMASTLLSEESNNQLNNALNGKSLKNNNRVLLSSDYESDNDKVRSTQASSPKPEALPINHRVTSPPAGRYVCSYCKLACAKPSVLQKHIRAHTNERPYPCLPCGFAFKTKSNLYKHCRSRAHASKLEESGEKMTVVFDGEDVGSSEDDGSMSGPNSSSIELRSEMDVDSRDETPKSIYKPKYRFMEQPSKTSLCEKSDERKENSTSPPRLHLHIPAPNTAPSVSTPSPFTSGSSPSPEFIHRHISKLISENQAIVETNDPFWSKKFLPKTNSTENSCSSPLSTSPSPSENMVLKKSGKNSVGSDSTEDSNCDKQTTKHSKLALALLKPQSLVSPMFSNPPAETCDPQPLNLSTTNKEQNGNNQNRKRSYSEGVPERSPKLVKDKVNSVPLKSHNHALQEFNKRLASTLSETSASLLLNHLDLKKEFIDCGQNPEGSIIKDLLLKARASGSAAVFGGSGVDATRSKHVSLSPPSTEDRAYSPSSQFMCHLCKEPVNYMNAENLELHQLYHCKSNERLTRSPLSNLSQAEMQQNYISYFKSVTKEKPVLITPSYPSPGPLLGSTPLIESYRTKSPISPDSTHTLLKKRKFDTGAVEKRTISATTLRSLEELSNSPICSNLQMFGGEVKILDNSSGEAKTLRIEPSNRNSPKAPSDMATSHQRRTAMKDENDLQKNSSSNMVVTFAKQGLHSGGAIVQVPQNNISNEQLSPRQLYNSKNVIPALPTSRLPGFQESNNIAIPVAGNATSNISANGLSSSVQVPFIPFTSILPESTINPLTNITAFNPLTLPPATLLEPKSPGIPSMYSPAIHSGIVTILHGGKEIPYVPGMPGPHSLLPNHSVPVAAPKADCNNKQINLTDNKANNQQELLRNGKTESIKKKPSTLVLSTVQVNNEKTVSSVESSVQRKRSFEESSYPNSYAFNTKTTTPKRNHMFSLPPESEDIAESSPEQKFLRPTSLPLKPGTFVPKRQQLTPVLSLVSPETPRPRKSYGQLYLNGHAYTYLGLKCSTRMFFCTLNKPQPIYVPLSPEHNKVSMYSNWKVCTEADPNPCGLDPGQAMALYDSRHRPATYTLAQTRNCEAVTHSSYWNSRTLLNQQKEETSETVPKRVKIFAGGFESNEEYTYVRGRGRGRYVCEECGIRCKKPSMLKKHIRTHTDVRPFTCNHCKFSFKTKGNLTKHMKSKAHYKKCVNLGIDPVPTTVDDSNVDEEALAHQQALKETQGGNAGDSEEDEEEEEDESEEEDEDDEDEGEGEDEDDMQSNMEREAARSLLTLSETIQSATQRQHGLVAVSARPNTYPYSFTQGTETQPQTPTLTSMSAQREREKVSQNTGLAREVQCEVKTKHPVEETTTEAVESSVSARYYFPLSQDSGNSGEESSAVQKQSTPIDLSNKTPEKSSPRVCEAAMLLASLCSTMEKLPISTTSPADSESSALLQAYLTERAVQDSRMKQHQYKHKTTTVELADHKAKNVPVPAPVNVSGADISAAKENALGILAQTSSDARRLPTPEPPASNKPQAEFLPPSSGPSPSYVSVLEDGRSMCNICNKVFSKPSQLRLHVNIHYFERPFRCESCAVSFRTKGHLQKHQRSVSHLNKVSMNSTFGTATTSNPRPFKCDDCKIAFRIHGHLAKHLRSKMHIMKLECLGKLPFGTYAELERSGINMNDIDTTDCENSLESLQLLAQKLYEKDPSKLGQWDPVDMMPHHGLSAGDTSSEEEEEDMPAPLPLPQAVDQSIPPQILPPPPVSSAQPYKGPKHKTTEPSEESKTELRESQSDRRTDDFSES